MEIKEAWNEGMETLDIYYAEDISPGEESWYVDVYQDEINESCHSNWTWTVINRKNLEQEGEKEDETPEWEILVDGPFSEQVVKDAVEKWLQERGYKFKVKMIPIEQAKGSGIIKDLRERLQKMK